MSSELKNTTEDAEMADSGEEKFVTMMDVLQEQEDIEEDANAVLGASDDKNCTYSKGYIKRQAIYACLTCCSEAKHDPAKRAGVCLACSLTCHETHELVELYTKRNFKCDCGNPKFNSHPCQFTPNKTDLNEDNMYNQNFSGVYCVCHRPYPDPESTVEVDMIQCIICEDWLHASHLEATVPANDLYSEMICKECVEKNNFLHDYSNIAVNTDNVTVDIITVNGIDNDKNTECIGSAKLDETNNTSNETLKINADIEMSEKMPDINVTATENCINNENSCSDKITPTIIETKNDENRSIKMSEKETENDEKQSNIPKETDQSKMIESTSSIEESFEKHVNNEESKTSEMNRDSILSSDKNIDRLNENTESITDSNQIANTSKIENEIRPVISESKTDPTNGENECKISNETEPITTESCKIPDEIKNVEKSAEQLEEERLLADPEDDLRKSDIREKDGNDSDKKENKIDIKCSDANQTETSKIIETIIPEKIDTIQETNIENVSAKLENEAASNIDHTQNESSNIESPNETLTKEVQDTVMTDVSEKNMIKDDTSSNTEDKNDNPSEVIIKAVHLNENKDSNITSIQSRPEESDGKDKTEKSTITDNNQHNGETEISSNEKGSEKRKLSTEESSTDSKKLKFDETNTKPCLRPKGIKRVYNGAIFWPSNFRQKLCTCKECITMYKDLSLLFLIDPEDTVTAYENLGKQKINGKPASQYEKGLQALSSLDRIQQINALTEYNKMRDKLLDFLKSFKDRKEVVKEEDIKAFFAGMKPKREPDGVYFCR